jgi:hypothetical protein
MTPRIEMTVTTDRKVRLGFKYFRARNNEKGKLIGFYRKAAKGAEVVALDIGRPL